MYITLKQQIRSVGQDYSQFDVASIDINWKLYVFDCQFNLALVLALCSEWGPSRLTLELARAKAVEKRHFQVLELQAKVGIENCPLIGIDLANEIELQSFDQVAPFDDDFITPLEFENVLTRQISAINTDLRNQNRLKETEAAKTPYYLSKVRDSILGPLFSERDLQRIADAGKRGFSRYPESSDSSSRSDSRQSSLKNYLLEGPTMQTGVLPDFFEQDPVSQNGAADHSKYQPRVDSKNKESKSSMGSRYEAQTALLTHQNSSGFLGQVFRDSILLEKDTIQTALSSLEDLNQDPIAADSAAALNSNSSKEPQKYYPRSDSKHFDASKYHNQKTDGFLGETFRDSILKQTELLAPPSVNVVYDFKKDSGNQCN
jgi:hypothetical protein